jgi:hypothetical protein
LLGYAASPCPYFLYKVRKHVTLKLVEVGNSMTSLQFRIKLMLESEVAACAKLPLAPPKVAPDFRVEALPPHRLDYKNPTG